MQHEIRRGATGARQSHVPVARVRPRTSSAAKAASRAAPSWPPAPVIRTRRRSRVSPADEDRCPRAPQIPHARIVPGDSLLVGIGRVVLLGHVIDEQQIGQRLEAVGVASRDVQRHGVVVADVLGERRAGEAVEHDDAGRPLQAGEEVVLATLVEVKAPDDALTRERNIGLDRLLGACSPCGSRKTTLARPRGGKGDPHDPLDAHLLAPVSLDRATDLREVLPVLAGVLPPAAHRHDRQLAPLRVRAVDVRDLELAAARRLEVGDDREDVCRITVEPTTAAFVGGAG